MPNAPTKPKALNPKSSVAEDRREEHPKLSLNRWQRQSLNPQSGVWEPFLEKPGRSIGCRGYGGTGVYGRYIGSGVEALARCCCVVFGLRFQSSACAHAHMHSHMYPSIHTYMHMHIYVYMYIYKYICV